MNILFLCVGFSVVCFIIDALLEYKKLREKHNRLYNKHQLLQNQYNTLERSMNPKKDEPKIVEPNQSVRPSIKSSVDKLKRTSESSDDSLLFAGIQAIDSHRSNDYSSYSSCDSCSDSSSPSCDSGGCSCD
jgi:hypothetical protein